MVIPNQEQPKVEEEAAKQGTENVLLKKLQELHKRSNIRVFQDLLIHEITTGEQSQN